MIGALSHHIESTQDGYRTTPSSTIDESKLCLSPRQKMLSRLRTILSCPHCQRSLDVAPRDMNRSDRIRCDVCGTVGKTLPSQIDMGGFTKSELKQDGLNRVKEWAKQRLGRFYPLAIAVLAPVYLRNLVPGFLKSFDLSVDLVADLGSGTNSYGERVLCIDGGDYANVHLTANLANLPIQNESLSGVVSVAVLEHVPNPAEHVAEILRILKPGGRVLCYIPFMQGFHASPHDYQRFTSQGMRKLFQNFTDVKVHVGAGPTSGLVWTLQEWIAIAFSFGNMSLYRMLVPLTWLLSPLKYLDLLFIHHPAAEIIASGFFVEASKPENL